MSGRPRAPRSGLRLADLKAARLAPKATRLLTVSLPTELTNAVDRLAERLHATRPEVMRALLLASLARRKQSLAFVPRINDSAPR